MQKYLFQLLTSKLQHSEGSMQADEWKHQTYPYYDDRGSGGYSPYPYYYGQMDDEDYSSGYSMQAIWYLSPGGAVIDSSTWG